MSLDPAKPLRKRLGVAVLAAGADLYAAANGIPGGVGPFDMGVVRHGDIRANRSIRSDLYGSLKQVFH
jgi:hypothetical protein